MIIKFYYVVAYGADNSSNHASEPRPQTTLLHLAGNDTANISSNGNISTGSNTSEVLEFSHSSENLSNPLSKTREGDMLSTTPNTPLWLASPVQMFNSSHDQNLTTNNNSSSAYPTETFTVKIVYLARLCMDSPRRLSKESLAMEVLRIRAAEHQLEVMESAINNHSQDGSPQIKLGKSNQIPCLIHLLINNAGF